MPPKRNVPMPEETEETSTPAAPAAPVAETSQPSLPLTQWSSISGLVVPSTSTTSQGGSSPRGASEDVANKLAKAQEEMTNHIKEERERLAKDQEQVRVEREQMVARNTEIEASVKMMNDYFRRLPGAIPMTPQSALEDGSGKDGSSKDGSGKDISSRSKFRLG